jgi:phosphatidylglycerophosphate synthase
VPPNSLNRQGARSSLKGGLRPTRLRLLPSIISIQRLVVLPLLILSLDYGLILAGYGLFLLAIATDFIDGYLAKKLLVTTKSGAYLDATIDFLFIMVMLLDFIAQGLYPVWLSFPIIIEYAQFMLTGLFYKVVYDPVGKYYGSILYGAIGLTLLFSGKLIISIIVTNGIIVVTAASLLSRLVYLIRASRMKL